MGVDYWQRIIELERRQMRFDMNRQETETRLTQAQTRANIISSGSFARSADQLPNQSPGDSYPFNMRKIWITVSWQTVPIADPYENTTAYKPTSGFPYPGARNGIKVLCDYNHSGQSFNNSVYTYGENRLSLGNFNSGARPRYEDRYRFICTFNSVTQKFTLQRVFDSWTDRAMYYRRYIWDDYYLWRRIDMYSIMNQPSDYYPSQWQYWVDPITIDYDPNNPQFTESTGAYTFQSTIHYYGLNNCVSHWTGQLDAYGNRYPYNDIPDPNYSPGTIYKFDSNDPDYDSVTNISGGCSVLVEWE